MPVWHDLTRELEAAGALRTLGLIQEQHPDRCRLFMQWKQMGWPVLVDPANALGVPVVPLTLLIDEHGVVRKVGAQPEDLQPFLAAEWEAPAAAPTPHRPPEEGDAGGTDGAPARDTPVPARHPAFAAGDEALLFGDAAALDDAVAAYEAALAAGAPAGPAHFRLGVAHERRHRSAARASGDFAAAIAHWRAALASDPNQYIWRRRIQQYGPRLDKPYPFYDWVGEARAAIEARGETPHPLTHEPRGAEIAHPSPPATADAPGTEPDPEGRIARDAAGLIDVEHVLVPTTRPERGRAARLHLSLRPDAALDAHWNNEVAPLAVWLDAPEGWTLDAPLQRAPMPSDRAVSDEARTVEFELAGPVDAPPPVLRGYALYYVCEGVDGTCLYLRQDLSLELPAAD